MQGHGLHCPIFELGLKIHPRNVETSSIPEHLHPWTRPDVDVLERTPPHISSHDPDGIDDLYAQYFLRCDQTHALAEIDESRKALWEECNRQYNLAESQVRNSIARNERRGKPKANAFDTILQIVAPTLEIFEVNLDSDETAGYELQNLALPKLTDMTAHGNFPLRLDAPHSSILGPCHSLRHLYIDAPSSCGHASYFFHSITTFAPELTHLRFSGLQQDEWIADHLEVALGLSEPGASTSKVENLPETMEMILIKPDAQPPLNGHCGTAILRYKQLQPGCRAVQKMDGRVILLRESTGSDEEGRVDGQTRREGLVGQS